jgi:hypothetical protein
MYDTKIERDDRNKLLNITLKNLEEEKSSLELQINKIRVELEVLRLLSYLE